MLLEQGWLVRDLLGLRPHPKTIKNIHQSQAITCLDQKQKNVKLHQQFFKSSETREMCTGSTWSIFVRCTCREQRYTSTNSRPHVSYPPPSHISSPSMAITRCPAVMPSPWASADDVSTAVNQCGSRAGQTPRLHSLSLSLSISLSLSLTMVKKAAVGRCEHCDSV